MRNYIQPGNNVSCPAPYTLVSGTGALIGPGLFGVAAMDYMAGATGQFSTVGVFDMAKAPGGVLAGAKLYWDNTARLLTTTATNNTYVGAAVLAAASAEPNIRIRLNGVAI